MAPNVTDPPMGRDAESVYNGVELEKKPPQPVVKASDDYYKLNIFQSSINQLAHIFVGMTVGITLLFALRNGLPIGATPQHVILCVLGYQLLMAEAILSLCPHNGWSQKLKLIDQRRAHWILQLLGSGLALGGCFLKILDKNVHWNTLHGQFALVSMVFTAVSLVNGLASLYAYELRQMLPTNASKLTHILFGIVGFASASIALAYGLDKNMFRNWATNEFTTALIIMVAAFTTIIIVNPCITFYRKSRAALKSN